MPALLEAPTPRTKRQAPPTAWTKEQAAKARANSWVARRNNTAKRKALAKQSADLLQSICQAEPLTDVERALSLAAKHGKAKAVESLASALAKLKRAGVGRPEQPSGTYTPTNGIAPRQPTPSTPQVAQAHAPQGHASDASFAQCTEPLVGPAKESLSCGTVGAGLPRQGPERGPAHGVIERITRTLEKMSLEELVKLEGQINLVKSEQPVSTIGVEPVKQSVGVKPEPVLEKFCLNGVWITGKRVK